MTRTGPVGPRSLMVSWTVDNGRSRDLAAAVEADLLLMPWAQQGRRAPRRALGWTRSAAATWGAVRDLPVGSLVIVMAPPVFAPLVVVLAARRKRLRVVLDAHSGTWNDPRWGWSRPLVRRLVRHTDLLVVTDPAVLALTEGAELVSSSEDRDRVAACGLVPATALPDPVPHGTDPGPQPDNPLPIVVFPASGAPDEPLAELGRAADLLRGEVVVVTTGRATSTDATALRMTGYLPRSEYEDLLATADLVLALSTREATMQRSAYEAVARGLPMVCSDTAVLRSTFTGAAVFTDHGPDELAAAVRAALHDAPRLRAGSRAVALVLENRQRSGLALLRALARTPEEHRGNCQEAS